MRPAEQPSFSDGVVWLTPFTEEDGAAIGEFNVDADHRRWFDQPTLDPDPRERQRHGEMVARRWQEQWSTGEALAFAVRLGVDHEAIGTAELQPRVDGRTDISYAIRPQWRRRGYAARAVRLLAEAGVDRFGYDAVELRCDVDNVASARTAERAGFEFRGIDPASGTFENVTEWIAQRRDERVYVWERSDEDGLRSGA